MSDTIRRQNARAKYELTRKKISIRYTSSEYALLRDFAEKAGTEIATFIHDVSLNPTFKIQPAQPRINLETKAMIQKMGVNLNQIARSLNNFYEQKEFAKIRDDLSSITDTLKNILKII
jgi:uncharacterized protein (DUF1778 family)